MPFRKPSLDDAAYYLTCGSILSILFSIAISNILLALAFAALLLSKQRMRFPPILLPLGALLVWTGISLAVSVDPSGGRPQIRKFFVFLIVLVAYSTVRTLPRIRAVLLLATAVMAGSAVWSLVQFAHKVQQANATGRPFYVYYTSERITGFMSHWMTVGGQEMIIILMAAALLFFALGKRWTPWIVAALAIIFASLLLGYTRSIWFGTFCGGTYLLWIWKRWWILLIPVILGLLILANPFALRERVRSAFQPHGDTDSNEFRRVCRLAGWEMIKAHPLFGVGPEQVKAQMKSWIPADVPRPLPTGSYIHLHNLYIHYGAERGIPGLLALLWLLGKMLYDFVRALRNATAEARAILHGAVAVLIGILVEAWYEVNLGDSEVLFLFLAIISFAYVAAGVAREREERIV